MADIMKVTTPIPGYDNAPKTNPISQEDKLIQNVVDPNRVVRPDGGAGTAQGKDAAFGFNYESNFEAFLHLIKDANGLSDTLTSLLFSKFGMMINSGIGENFAAEISKFLELLKMDEGQLLQIIKEQASTGVKFSGEFFDVLNNILKSTPSMDLKTEILDFLKKYNDLTAGPHILDAIAKNIKGIAQSIPHSFSKPLIELMAKLNLNAQTGDVAANTALLKEQIIPFLSNYVRQTYDMGKARSIISLLTLNIARYENGGMEGMLKAFANILGFNGASRKLEGYDAKWLMEFALEQSIDSSADKSEAINQLLNIIRDGMSGKGGHESRAVFENIVNAMLVNESVYMPLLHIILPAQIFGQMIFSEMWIDPDHEPPGGESDGEGRQIKLFIKFDIKDLGYFEMIVSYQNENVDLQLFYPQDLGVPEKDIRNSIANIMERNGLNFKTFLLDKCRRQRSISEVFPKIYERKNSVNVRI